MDKDLYLCMLMLSYKVKSCSFHAGVSLGSRFRRQVSAGGAASFWSLYFEGMKKKTSPCLSDAADFFVPLRA